MKKYNSRVKRLSLLLLASFALTELQAQQLTVKVTNPSKFQRQELVELNNADLHRQLNLPDGAILIVRNAFGQEITSQRTHDGLLLFEAAARPGCTSTYTVQPGKPAQYKPVALGAYYPQRLDDVTWENDRAAYRVYGPALQTTGERSFGIDVWCKTTPEPVVEKRYKDNNYGNEVRSAFKERGFQAIHDSLYLATSFHIDHGDGLDAYAVGASLGCGTPAIFDGKELLFPYCYKDYEILDNGPLRFTLALTYNPSSVGKDKNVVEHRIISLDKGSNFNRCELWYDGLSAPVQVAAGVVVHQADMSELLLNNDKILYADPTDRPAQLGEQVYTGVLFPQLATKAQVLPQNSNGIAGNAVGLFNYRPGNANLVYYFGSAWSAYDVRSFDEWNVRATQKLEAIAQPLVVTVEE